MKGKIFAGLIILSIALLAMISGCSEQKAVEKVVKNELAVFDFSADDYPSDERVNWFCLSKCDVLESYINNRIAGVFECKCLKEKSRFYDYQTGAEVPKEAVEARINAMLLN